MWIAFHEFIKVKLDTYSSEYETIKILLEIEISSGTLRVCNKYFDNLMFFWPCIMNWLYINYQLDALIIIYS